MTEIHRERTAVSRKNASPSVFWAHKEGIVRPVVFDWGCGKGRGSSWLREKGFEVVSYDPFYDNTKTPDCVDFRRIRTILLIDVLNVIEDREERDGLVCDMSSLSKKGTTIIISVPRNKDIETRAEKSNWKSYADGFVTKNKTFQKGYTLGEFADTCMKIGSLIL